MDKELVEYIENNIFPLYQRNDWAHQLWHILEVIDRSLKLSKDYDVNLNMVYTIAAFHDIGCYLGRDSHEEKSASLMINDEFILNYFTTDEVSIMEKAIIDHRGSLEYEPRSIYGKIISTADRFVTIEGILRSTHSHTLEFFSFLPWDEQVIRSYEYIAKKYGKNGYAKCWIPNPPYYKFLEDVSYYLDHKELFEKKLKEVDELLRSLYSVKDNVKYKIDDTKIVVEVGIKLDRDFSYYDTLLKDAGFVNDIVVETHDIYYTKENLDGLTENEMKNSCIRLRNEKDSSKEEELIHLGYRKVFDTKKIDYQYSRDDIDGKIQIQDIQDIGLLVYYDNKNYYSMNSEEQWNMLVKELNSYGFAFSDDVLGLDKLRTLYYGKEMYSKNQNG